MKLLLYGCEPVNISTTVWMIVDWIRVLGVRHPALGTNAKLRDWLGSFIECICRNIIMLASQP